MSCCHVEVGSNGIRGQVGTTEKAKSTAAQLVSAIEIR
jgi:hypothetical protein